MSKRRWFGKVLVRAIATILLVSILPLATTLAGASLPVPGWIIRRFNPEAVQMRDEQGISERIVNGKLTLDVHSFLELALKNSSDINISRMDGWRHRDQVKVVRMQPDPVLSLGFNTLRSESPQFSQIGGASILSSLSGNSFVSYQELVPTGQSVNVGFIATRNSTNSEFNIFNPSISGSLNFSIVQPLLQNRNGIQFKAPLKIARSQLAITSKQTEASIAVTLAAAAGQYWDAVRARDNVKVLQQTLDLAQKSYERDKQALDLGALAGLDIYQSQTQVAQRKTDLVQAQYSYIAALDGLRKIIGADVTPQLRALEIILTDDPARLPENTAILPYRWRTRRRCAYGRNWRSRERPRSMISTREGRRNLMLPRVDLTIQGQSAGLGGNQVAVVGPPEFPSRPYRVTDGFLGRPGFQFAQLRRGDCCRSASQHRATAARAQLADALVARTRDRYFERQAEQQIAQDVRQAITAIQPVATIESARSARRAAQKMSTPSSRNTNWGDHYGVRGARLQSRPCVSLELAAERVCGLSAGLRELRARYLDAAGRARNSG